LLRPRTCDACDEHMPEQYHHQRDGYRQDLLFCRFNGKYFVIVPFGFLGGVCFGTRPAKRDGERHIKQCEREHLDRYQCYHFVSQLWNDRCVVYERRAERDGHERGEFDDHASTLRAFDLDLRLKFYRDEFPTLCNFKFYVRRFGTGVKRDAYNACKLSSCHSDEYRECRSNHILGGECSCGNRDRHLHRHECFFAVVLPVNTKYHE